MDEGDGLENRWPARVRGFESLPLRSVRGALAAGHVASLDGRCASSSAGRGEGRVALAPAFLRARARGMTRSNVSPNHVSYCSSLHPEASTRRRCTSGLVTAQTPSRSAAVGSRPTINSTALATSCRRCSRASWTMSAMSPSVAAASRITFARAAERPLIAVSNRAAAAVRCRVASARDGGELRTLGDRDRCSIVAQRAVNNLLQENSLRGEVAVQGFHRDPCLSGDVAHPGAEPTLRDEQTMRRFQERAARSPRPVARAAASDTTGLTVQPERCEPRPSRA